MQSYGFFADYSIFFVTLAAPKLLSFGSTKKKLHFFFVLLSFFRNFAQNKKISRSESSKIYTRTK